MALSPWPGEWGLDAGALLLAVALDLALREPPAALHPVVWMGRLIGFLERRSPPADRPAASLAAGLAIAVLVPAGCGALAWLAATALRAAGPLPYLLGTAALLKTTFAVKGLSRAVAGARDALQSGDLDRARDSLRSLVSRDARSLTGPQVAMAAIESAAENTTDSYVAPWLAFALFGLPGAVAYRAVNTLDSMIGYRGRYEHLGKASARLDDLVNLLPARLAALLMLAAGALHRLPARRGWEIARRDHGRTASPNAGWTIAACAGLLGVALEKTCHYRIGDGFRDPFWYDVGAAARLVYSVALLAAPAAITVAAVRGLIWG
ncbi:MAG: adenosylcobinamide-phosphate synthase CbiB [Spirochaetaceae bacterium]|nr:adenosylcobinamide-phosphate synthase CbiB [Spirochaetaceae bacterium]